MTDQSLTIISFINFISSVKCLVAVNNQLGYVQDRKIYNPHNMTIMLDLDCITFVSLATCRVDYKSTDLTQFDVEVNNDLLLSVALLNGINLNCDIFKLYNTSTDRPAPKHVQPRHHRPVQSDDVKSFVKLIEKYRRYNDFYLNELYLKIDLCHLGTIEPNGDIIMDGYQYVGNIYEITEVNEDQDNWYEVRFNNSKSVTIISFLKEVNDYFLP